MKGTFFCAARLDSGLDVRSDPCCWQTGRHPGFVVPFTQRRQSGFSMTREGPG